MENIALFIILTIMLGFVCIAWILTDIKIELKRNNALLIEQNRLLKDR